MRDSEKRSGLSRSNNFSKRWGRPWSNARNWRRRLSPTFNSLLKKSEKPLRTSESPLPLFLSSNKFNKRFSRHKAWLWAMYWIVNLTGNLSWALKMSKRDELHGPVQFIPICSSYVNVRARPNPNPAAQRWRNKKRIPEAITIETSPKECCTLLNKWMSLQPSKNNTSQWRCTSWSSSVRLCRFPCLKTGLLQFLDLYHHHHHHLIYMIFSKKWEDGCALNKYKSEIAQE